MGCTDSVPQEELMNYRQQINQLKNQLKLNEVKTQEQQNLLRFKIEVLVNMLTAEEQRNDLAGKRLETMKWLLQQQGITEETMISVLRQVEGELFAGNKSLAQGDVGEATLRMRLEFERFKEDILHSLADENGKILSSMPRIDFMKQVYNASEDITKQDVEVLAIRFDDGFGAVNVVEFLEFFLTNNATRTAKSAAAAVRMSFDLLAMGGATQPHDMDDSDSILRSHPTHGLDRASRRFLSTYPLIREELVRILATLQEPGPDCLIRSEVFQKTLLELCGRKSVYLASLLAKDGNAFVWRDTVTTASSNNSHVNSPHANANNKVPLEKSNSNSSSVGDKENASPNPKAKANAKTSSGSGSSGSGNVNIAEAKDSNTSNNNAKDKDKDSKTSNAKGGEEKKSLALSDPTSSTTEMRIVDALEPGDEILLLERFELDGLVSYDLFLRYFDEALSSTTTSRMHYSKYTDSLSPFRVSSEWVSLRDASLLKQLQQGNSQGQGTLPPAVTVNANKSPTVPPNSSTKPPAPVAAATPNASNATTPKPSNAANVAEPKVAAPKPTAAATPTIPMPATTTADSKTETKPGATAEDKKHEDHPTAEGKKEAPVAPSSGAWCCGGGGSSAPNPNQPLTVDTTSDAKDTKTNAKDSKDAKDAKQLSPLRKGPSTSHITLSPATDSHHMGDSKDSEEDDTSTMPPLKGSFTPKAATTSGGGVSKRAMFDLPDRDGLGKGDAANSNSNSRLRRRQDRDFDKETSNANAKKTSDIDLGHTHTNHRGNDDKDSGSDDNSEDNDNVHAAVNIVRSHIKRPNQQQGNVSRK